MSGTCPLKGSMYPKVRIEDDEQRETQPLPSRFNDSALVELSHL
jgi:hypothetical protein